MSKFPGTIIGICFSVLAASAQAPRFERDILPIFTVNCLSCHGGTSIRNQAGLDLRTVSATLKGSNDGPVIAKGSSENSVLYQQVANRSMPPAASKLTLTDAQIETIRKWIEAGAPSDADPDAGKSDELIARFEKEVRPILSARCFSCHGKEKPMAGLDLRTFTSVLKGSINGPVVIEGTSDKSILIRKVATRSMPPPGAGEPLSDAEIQVLRRWIETSHFSDRIDSTPALREASSEGSSQGEPRSR